MKGDLNIICRLFAILILQVDYNSKGSFTYTSAEKKNLIFEMFKIVDC